MLEAPRTALWSVLCAAMMVIAPLLYLRSRAPAAVCHGVGRSFMDAWRRLKAAPATSSSLPQDFDWEAYKMFNPEVAGGMATRAAAERHYLQHGRQQGRLYRRIPLFLSYTATWGLCNQLFTHLSMLAVAAHMNATLVPSPAYSRSSFSTLLGNEGFKREPLCSLLDVDRMAAYWAERGLRITQVGPYAGRRLLEGIWGCGAGLLYNRDEMVLQGLSKHFWGRRTACLAYAAWHPKSVSCCLGHG
jgi:hypothetical protein